MRSDGELLRRYAEDRSEDAFAELVQRHLNLVYSAALRQVNGDAILAEDIAQTGFYRPFAQGGVARCTLQPYGMALGQRCLTAPGRGTITTE